MPELHKIKLHSQAAAAAAAGKTSGSRMKKHIELSNVHFTFQKLTCHTAQVQVKVQVCVCVYGKSNLYATLRTVLAAHTLNDCASSALRLRRVHTTFPSSLSLYLSILFSACLSLYLSGQLLSVVLTMLKTQLNHHLHL